MERGHLSVREDARENAAELRSLLAPAGCERRITLTLETPFGISFDLAMPQQKNIAHSGIKAQTPQLSERLLITSPSRRSHVGSYIAFPFCSSATP